MPWGKQRSVKVKRGYCSIIWKVSLPHLYNGVRERQPQIYVDHGCVQILIVMIK